MPFRPLYLLSVLFTLLLGSPAVLADKGERHGHGRDHEQRYQERDHRHDRHDDRRDNAREYGYYRDDRRHDDNFSVNLYFGDPQRRAINAYYEPEFRRGHCPPGLRKKGHHCVPPGHTRYWQHGHALPRTVAYYPLPPALMVELPPPPRGHRYVRVGADILLIAIGTGLVVDAIMDIGGY